MPLAGHWKQALGGPLAAHRKLETGALPASQQGLTAIKAEQVWGQEVAAAQEVGDMVEAAE